MFSEGLGCSKIFSKKICTAVHILGFVRDGDNYAEEDAEGGNIILIF